MAAETSPDQVSGSLLVKPPPLASEPARVEKFVMDNRPFPLPVSHPHCDRNLPRPSIAITRAAGLSGATGFWRVPALRSASKPQPNPFRRSETEPEFPASHQLPGAGAAPAP